MRRYSWKLERVIKPQDHISTEVYGSTILIGGAYCTHAILKAAVSGCTWIGIWGCIEFLEAVEEGIVTSLLFFTGATVFGVVAASWWDDETLAADRAPVVGVTVAMDPHFEIVLSLFIAV